MSCDSASPSGSSDRSLHGFNQCRDVSSDSLQAQYHALGREPPLHRMPSGLQASRSYKDGPEHHESVTPTKTRNSGGFLLEPYGAASRSAFIPRSKNDTSNGKGKESPGLMITKRRSRQSQKSSIGSSPLATKVTTLEDHADLRTGSPDQDGSGSRLSAVSESTNVNSRTLQGESQRVASTSQPTAIGYDTDPMQVVNLALSLSEGRRRQISGMRLMSGSSGIERSASRGQRITSRVTRPQSSLGQYLHSGRQFSRNRSSETQAQGHGQPPSMKTFNKSAGIAGGLLQPVTIDDANFNLQNDSHDVSDATFTRVQKAKDHFELLYEYRRLLPHLPPLRETKGVELKSAIEGRAYNPLQYARNRKVRFQEAEPGENDAKGWHDVQKVRAWVDAIVEGHTDLRSDPDECIRLPELHPDSEPNQEDPGPTKVETPSWIKLKRDINQNGKPRRPRSDWVVSPADLLADVYWLEQGLNKTRIEDRDGKKIYPWNTEMKYTGWRNRNPAYGQGSLQSSDSPDPVGSSKSRVSAPVAPPQLPAFTSTGRKGKHRRRGRRHETKPKIDLGASTSDSESHKRGKRLRKTLIRPLSTSSTSHSDDERRSRPPVRSRQREIEESATESSSVDHYMWQMLDRDTRHSGRSIGADRPKPHVERSRSTAMDPVRHHSPVEFSIKQASSKKRKKSDHLLESVSHSLDKMRQSRPSFDAERPARASLDGETTAPSSPSIHHFPSIAINLSPPPSRSPSPKRKLLHTRINRFRDRNQSKHDNGIDAADFADVPPLPSLRQKNGNSEKEAAPLNDGSRDTSPMTKSTRRASDTSISRADSPRTQSTGSKTSAKTTQSPDTTSRVRGIFKGGRIAQLVGNEVSRVGDFIWKREPPSETRTSSSASSAKARHGSDTGEELRANDNLQKQPPRPHSGRSLASAEGSSKNVSSGEPRSPLGSGDKPAYFMSNLPSFTSPFQKDREVQEERDRAAFPPRSSSPPNPNAQGTSDHISMAAAHHRSFSRSPRLDRLAPPKLNISLSNSPAGLPDSRRESYGFGKNLSLQGHTSAIQDRHHALGRPQGAPPVTGLTGLRASRSGEDLTRNWDRSARDGSTGCESNIVSKKDVARARALLLSSGVKARQISLRAHLIRPVPPKFLLDTVEASSSREILKSLGVPRKDEHVLAAQNLTSTLATQSTTFRTCLDHFTFTTSPSLHKSLQSLDDLVENTFTPRVRAAADESGDLSMKLTTTSTLAVKSLNDVIDSAMRRRRKGPVRWLRRFGYWIVEWMVVGLLWAIWLVVSIFRIVIGVVRGSYRALRWLVWLD